MIVTRPESVPKERLSKIEYFENDIPELKSAFREIVSRETYARKNKRSICADFATLDTETTSVARQTLWNNTDTDIGFIYLVQLHIAGKNFIFRTIYDFKDAIEQVVIPLLNEAESCIVIYIHNFSFEFQFLKSVISMENVFALKNRRIAKALAYDGAIEFRCSYLLSNMSLEKFTENYNDEKYRKDKELIDYEIKRYPWTELSDEILYYSLMDVITLYQAILSIMNREGDTLRTIPMTNTGYVRRACRNACIGEYNNTRKKSVRIEMNQRYGAYKKLFYKCELSLEQYNMCVKAFRGGNTHASRFYADQILNNVGSYDFASSYPAVVICSDQFPVGKLDECTNDVQTMENLIAFSEKFFTIIEVVFETIELRDPYNCSVPYIPIAKVERVNENDCSFISDVSRETLDIINDNGRIIRMNKPVRFTFLGVELSIILKQYTGIMHVTKCYYAEKGYLPEALRRTCYEWYEKKTSLKHVAGMEYEYMKSKNRVNSVYGMMVEQIIKEMIEYSSEDKLLHSRQPTEDEAKEQLKNYYTPMQRKFLAYQWGITVTAVARVRLQEMIDICGNDFVYCDTDSCKMLNPEKYLNAFEEYNKKWIDYADNCGCNYFAYTKDGEKQILGVADYEGKYDKFKTLGAKKYAVEKNGELEITIAGVPKRAGAQLLGILDNFKVGYRFEVKDDAPAKLRQDWKKTLTYNDDFNELFFVDGKELHIQSNVAILRTTYELSITDEYQELINNLNSIYTQDDI